MLTLLSGCSTLNPTPPDEQRAQNGGYCLRAGEQQAYDCSAPALDIRQVRDPLQPDSQTASLPMKNCSHCWPRSSAGYDRNGCGWKGSRSRRNSSPKTPHRLCPKPAR